MVRVLDSCVPSPHQSWFAFEAQAISFTPICPSILSYKWVPTLLGRYLRWTSALSRRVSTTALQLLALNETRFKHWPSLAFIAYLRHTVWWMNLPTFYQSKLASLNTSINNTYSSHIAMTLYTSHKSTIQRTPIRASYLGHSPETWSLLWHGGWKSKVQHFIFSLLQMK